MTNKLSIAIQNHYFSIEVCDMTNIQNITLKHIDFHPLDDVLEVLETHMLMIESI